MCVRSYKDKIHIQFPPPTGVATGCKPNILGKQNNVIESKMNHTVQLSWPPFLYPAQNVVSFINASPYQSDLEQK